MKFSALCFVMIACLSRLAQANDPKLFSLRVALPSTQQTCEEHAAAIASLIAAETTVTNATGTCRGNQTITDNGTSYPLDVVVVTYLATQELQSFKAIFGGSEFEGNPEVDSGWIDTYSGCLDLLKAQTPLFEAETGLRMVLGHCELAGNGGRPGYSLILEGFGTSRRSFYAFIPETSLAGPDVTSSVTRAARSAIGNSHGEVVFADQSRVFYYASSYIFIYQADLGAFAAPSECEDQCQQARDAFGSAGLAEVNAFCEPFMVSDQNYVFLSILGIGDTTASAESSHEHYPTFAACKSDESRVLANFTSSGRKVLGAICHPTLDAGGSYSMDIYL